jgi:hypothetical protein
MQTMKCCSTEGWVIRKAFENAAAGNTCQAELGMCQAPAAWCCESHKPLTFTYVCLAHKLHFEKTGHFFGLMNQTEGR